MYNKNQDDIDDPHAEQHVAKPFSIVFKMHEKMKITNVHDKYGGKNVRKMLICSCPY